MGRLLSVEVTVGAFPCHGRGTQVYTNMNMKIESTVKKCAETLVRITHAIIKI